MCMFNIWNKNQSIFDTGLEEETGQKAQPPLKWILDSYQCDGAEREIGGSLSLIEMIFLQ